MKEEDGVVGIRGAMRDFLVEEGMQELEDLLRIKEVWTGLVGEKTAAVTKPYRLEEGRLYIGTVSHAGAQNVHFHVEEIKKHIKEQTGIEIREVAARKINLK